VEFLAVADQLILWLMTLFVLIISEFGIIREVGYKAGVMKRPVFGLVGDAV
jgi:hypothetical protein